MHAKYTQCKTVSPEAGTTPATHPLTTPRFTSLYNMINDPKRKRATVLT